MMSNPFTSFSVIPNFNTGHFIHWSLNPDLEVEKEFSFTVEISNDAAFNELNYSLPAGKNLFVVDTTRQKQSFSDDTHLRVRLDMPGVVHYSNTIIFGHSRTANTYIKAANIVRKELLRLKRKAGSPMWLLKRKMTGVITTPLVDPVSGVPLTDSKIEFGVGLDGGYYPPIGFYASLEDGDRSKAFVQGGFGVKETEDLTFRTIGFPNIDVRDIVIDHDADIRYNVVSQSYFLYPSSSIVIIQEFKTKTIPVTDTIYSIDLPLKHEFAIL